MKFLEKLLNFHFSSNNEIEEILERCILSKEKGLNSILNEYSKLNFVSNTNQISKIVIELEKTISKLNNLNTERLTPQEKLDLTQLIQKIAVIINECNRGIKIVEKNSNFQTPQKVALFSENSIIENINSTLKILNSNKEIYLLILKKYLN